MRWTFPLLFLWLLSACVGSPQEDPVQEPVLVDAGSAKSGAELVARYCAQCHGLPQPRQLPKEAWPELFREMNTFAKRWPDRGTHEAAAHAEHQVWDEASNQIMLDYFVEGALSEQIIRESVEKPKARQLTDAQFELTPLEIPSGYFLTMFKYDPVQRMVFYGLGRTFTENGELKLVDRNGLAIADHAWQPVWMTGFSGPPIDIEFRQDSFRLTLIGGLGTDTRSSKVIEFTPAKEHWMGREILAGLPRSVGSRSRDFDQDGEEDVLVIGFGGNSGTGELAMHWGKKGSESFTEQVLFPGSGALGAEVADFDGDGRLDILVLISQRNPHLRLYLNQGERQFKESVVMQRPVGWGYMDFEVVDFDDDGDLDVVTVTGNNMEFGMPPLKPYHGIRVLINDGEMALREAYFYPLYGAGQCAVADVDGDGDLDIAATAFTADWEAESPETFVLLVQAEPLTFEPYHPPQPLEKRWTFLTKGDQLESGATRIFVAHSWMPFGAPTHLTSEFEKDLEIPARVYILDLSTP